MMRCTAMLLTASLAISSLSAEAMPREFVPDAETAKSIARAVFLARQGPSALDGQEPLIVTRKRGVWIVKGAAAGFVPQTNGKETTLYIGGWSEVRILAKDGRILKFTATQ